MPLVNCPECNNLISDKAAFCPQCGFPLSGNLNSTQQTISGYIYVLSNPSFGKEMYKIGKTTREPEDRAAELSSHTGVPEPFTIQYKQHVTDCDTAEKMVHGALKDCRYNNNREFFQIELNLLIKICQGICDAINTTSKDTTKDDSEEIPVIKGFRRVQRIEATCEICNYEYAVTVTRFDDDIVCPKCFSRQKLNISW